mgnify:CR=1 FL=1
MFTIETLARFQFAMTTIFHFFFVPLSVGMVLMTAIMETIYVKTGDEKWKKRTKFFGSIMLLSFDKIREFLKLTRFFNNN